MRWLRRNFFQSKVIGSMFWRSSGLWLLTIATSCKGQLAFVFMILLHQRLELTLQSQD